MKKRTGAQSVGQLMVRLQEKGVAIPGDIAMKSGRSFEGYGRVSV